MSSEKTLLLFVHGFFGSSASFGTFPMDLVAQLRSPPTAIRNLEVRMLPTYDCKGDNAVAVNHLVKWLALNAPREEFDSVVILAHSLGGLLAFDAYRKLHGLLENNKNAFVDNGLKKNVSGQQRDGDPASSSSSWFSNLWTSSKSQQGVDDPTVQEKKEDSGTIPKESSKSNSMNNLSASLEGRGKWKEFNQSDKDDCNVNIIAIITFDSPFFGVHPSVYTSAAPTRAAAILAPYVPASPIPKPALKNGNSDVTRENYASGEPIREAAIAAISGKETVTLGVIPGKTMVALDDTSGEETVAYCEAAPTSSDGRSGDTIATTQSTASNTASDANETVSSTPVSTVDSEGANAIPVTKSEALSPSLVSATSSLSSLSTLVTSIPSAAHAALSFGATTAYQTIATAPSAAYTTITSAPSAAYSAVAATPATLTSASAQAYSSAVAAYSTISSAPSAIISTVQPVVASASTAAYTTLSSAPSAAMNLAQSTWRTASSAIENLPTTPAVKDKIREVAVNAMPGMAVAGAVTIAGAVPGTLGLLVKNVVVPRVTWGRIAAAGVVTAGAAAAVARTQKGNSASTPAAVVNDGEDDDIAEAQAKGSFEDEEDKSQGDVMFETQGPVETAGLEVTTLIAAAALANSEATTPIASERAEAGSYFQDVSLVQPIGNDGGFGNSDSALALAESIDADAGALLRRASISLRESGVPTISIPSSTLCCVTEEGASATTAAAIVADPVAPTQGENSEEQKQPPQEAGSWAPWLTLGLAGAALAAGTYYTGGLLLAAPLVQSVAVTWAASHVNEASKHLRFLYPLWGENKEELESRVAAVLVADIAVRGFYVELPPAPLTSSSSDTSVSNSTSNDKVTSEPRTFVNPPPQSLCHLFQPTTADAMDVISAHMYMFDRTVNAGEHQRPTSPLKPHVPLNAIAMNKIERHVCTRHKCIEGTRRRNGTVVTFNTRKRNGDYFSRTSPQEAAVDTAHGKNLIFAFHQSRRVFIDILIYNDTICHFVPTQLDWTALSTGAMGSEREGGGAGDSDDEEVFEIIDFTSASPWERFVSSIESLLITWGIDDGRLGVFDPERIAQRESSAAEATAAGYFSKKDVVMFGDQSYVLGYHFLAPPDVTNYHRDEDPAEVMEHGQSWQECLESQRRREVLPFPDFLPLDSRSTNSNSKDAGFKPEQSSQSQGPHPLHAWTGHTHLLLLTPFSIYDIFDADVTGAAMTGAWNGSGAGGGGAGFSILERLSGSGDTSISGSDKGLTKMLISSFAVAFQNTGCCIPAFVPSGPSWKGLYSGYRLSSGPLPYDTTFSTAYDNDLCTDDQVDMIRDPPDEVEMLIARLGLDASDIVFRYRSLHLPHVPPAYCSYAGLKSLFLDLLARNLSRGSLNEIQAPSDMRVTCAAQFTFDLRVPVNEPWRSFETISTRPYQSSSPIQRGARSRTSSSSSSNTGSPMLGVSTDQVFALPVGPSSDPILSLSLRCYFPRETAHLLDGPSLSDVDVLNSPFWHLVFTNRTRGDGTALILGGIVRRVIREWNDASVRQDVSANNGELFTGSEQAFAENAAVPFTTPKLSASANLPGSFGADGGRIEPKSDLLPVETGVRSNDATAHQRKSDLGAEITARAVVGVGKRVVRNAVLSAMGMSASQGSFFGLVESTDVENIVRYLYSPFPSSMHAASEKGAATPSSAVGEVPASQAPWKYRQASGTPPTAAQLINSLRGGAGVPHGSILWMLAVRLLDSVSPSSSLSYVPSSSMALLKAVWAEYLRLLRFHWERGTAIPNVDTSDGIDLRWSLVHQKICMINCCIMRQRKSGKSFSDGDVDGRTPTGSPGRSHGKNSSSRGSLGGSSRGASPPRGPFFTHGHSNDGFLVPPPQQAASLSSSHKQHKPLSSRFLSTLSTLASGVAEEVVGGITNLVSSDPGSASAGGGANSSAGGSVIEKIFDRLTAEASTSHLGGAAATSSKPPPLASLAARSAVSRPVEIARRQDQSSSEKIIQMQQPLAHNIAAHTGPRSWSSDLSWEDFSLGRPSTSSIAVPDSTVGGGGGGTVALTARSSEGRTVPAQGRRSDRFGIDYDDVGGDEDDVDDYDDDDVLDGDEEELQMDGVVRHRGGGGSGGGGGDGGGSDSDLFFDTVEDSLLRRGGGGDAGGVACSVESSSSASLLGDEEGRRRRRATRGGGGGAVSGRGGRGRRRAPPPELSSPSGQVIVVGSSVSDDGGILATGAASSAGRPIPRSDGGGEGGGRDVRDESFASGGSSLGDDRPVLVSATSVSPNNNNITSYNNDGGGGGGGVGGAFMGESFIQLPADFSPMGSIDAAAEQQPKRPPTTPTGIAAADVMDDDPRWSSSMEVSDPDGVEGATDVDSGLRLLMTGEPLRIPQVQEPGFMTEDMIEEQERIFERLGSSAEAGRIRARMQCAHLSSDMESFKAANPHALIEDFVRWHSPRDWIEDDDDGGGDIGDDDHGREEAATSTLTGPSPSTTAMTATAGGGDGSGAMTDSFKSSSSGGGGGGGGGGNSSSTTPRSSAAPSPSPQPPHAVAQKIKGRMSSRMVDSGNNLWQEVWRTARRVPANRQRPLFDAVLEAEKALHFLDGLSPGALVATSGLLPAVFCAAYGALVEHPVARRVRCVEGELVEVARLIAKTRWRDIGANVLNGGGGGTGGGVVASGEGGEDGGVGGGGGDHGDRCSRAAAMIEEVMDRLEGAERRLSLAVSLLNKFPMQYDLVEALLVSRGGGGGGGGGGGVDGGEARIRDSRTERETVLDLFLDPMATTLMQQHLQAVGGGYNNDGRRGRTVSQSLTSQAVTVTRELLFRSRCANPPRPPSPPRPEVMEGEDDDDDGQRQRRGRVCLDVRKVPQRMYARISGGLVGVDEGHGEVRVLTTFSENLRDICSINRGSSANST